MSAALVVLPSVWAFAETVSAGREEMPNLGKKGPHRLRLVRAQAEVVPPTELEIVAPAEEERPETEVPELVVMEEVEVAEAPQKAAPINFYRKYTEAMLKRYLSMSMEGGRVPSLLGRELFRGRVTSYKVHSFEDVVVYVHDVEKCVAELDKGLQHLIRRIALQGFTQEDTAAMHGIPLRTVTRKYGEALDAITRMFLWKGLLKPMRECRQEEACVAVS